MATIPEHWNLIVNTSCEVYTTLSSKCCDNTTPYIVGTVAGNVCRVML